MVDSVTFRLILTQINELVSALTEKIGVLAKIFDVNARHNEQEVRQ